MSNPYPPARRLTRSSTDRKLAGVCGGLAEYLNLDPTLVRLLVVVLTVTTGVPLAIYVLAMLVMPEDDRTQPSNRVYPPIYPPNAVPGPRPAPPAGLGDPIWGREGAPWEQPQNAPRPGRSADPDAPSDLR